MIKLMQIGRHSLHLEVDREGCSLMLQAFQNALQHQTASVEVILDKHIYSHKHELISRSISVMLSQEDNFLSGAHDLFVLALEHDDLTYAIYQFSEGYTNGGFFPAELCDINVRQRSFTIYTMMVEG